MQKDRGAEGHTCAASRRFALRESAKFRVQRGQHCIRGRIILAAGNCQYRKARLASQNSSPKPGVRVSLLQLGRDSTAKLPNCPALCEGNPPGKHNWLQGVPKQAWTMAGV
jgi:hypothetical protein